MVYCGKPSANCGNCRARKRRCDKAVPVCGQCVRMGQTCPGYRDLSDLLFRNETTRTVQRATTSATSQATLPAIAPPKDGDGDGDILVHLQREPTTPSPPRVRAAKPPRRRRESAIAKLAHDNDTQKLSPLGDFDFYTPAAPSSGMSHLGLNYFEANFSYIGSDAALVYLSYAMDQLRYKKKCAAIVEPVVSAVGLAALANITGNGNVVRSARSLYVKALHTTNEALRDARNFKEDATVVSILLLGFFESMTCIGSDSLEAWSRHIDGATSLLLHRGTSQFHTTAGQHVFQEVCAYLLASCSRLKVPFPQSVLDLRKQASMYIHSDEPSWMLSTTYIEVIDIYQKVDLTISEPTMEDSWERLLLRALELDEKVVEFFATLPDIWDYIVHKQEGIDTEIAYQGTWHDYYDMWVGRYLNSMRSCRMFLNLTINCLSQREWARREPNKKILGKAHSEVNSIAIHNMETMRDDMYASVALMMGYVRHGKLYSKSLLEEPSAKAKGKPELERVSMAMGCYFIFWHLYVAGSLSINSPETRSWAARRLRTIRRLAGIQKAQLLAQCLDAGLIISVRLTENTLGKYIK